jgi:hypothetical protein
VNLSPVRPERSAAGGRRGVEGRAPAWARPGTRPRVGRAASARPRANDVAPPSVPRPSTSGRYAALRSGRTDTFTFPEDSAREELGEKMMSLRAYSEAACPRAWATRFSAATAELVIRTRRTRYLSMAPCAAVAHRHDKKQQGPCLSGPCTARNASPAFGSRLLGEFHDQTLHHRFPFVKGIPPARMHPGWAFTIRPNLDRESVLRSALMRFLYLDDSGKPEPQHPSKVSRLPAFPWTSGSGTPDLRAPRYASSDPARSVLP